jgi:site-specific DNA recombinase
LGHEYTPREHYQRRCLLAHTYDETKALVSPEVAARLDPSRLYGIWWHNRTMTKITQVSAIGQNGKEYARRAECVPKPREEWVAVPVPDSGVPREWVDTAREAIRDNRVPSSAGHRFWELSGGILRFGGCGNGMMTKLKEELTAFKKGRPELLWGGER